MLQCGEMDQVSGNTVRRSQSYSISTLLTDFLPLHKDMVLFRVLVQPGKMFLLRVAEVIDQ